MLVMIVSDSHSMNKTTLINTLKKHPADYYIHCGDIFMPYKDLELTHFYNVRGNNDGPQITSELNLEIDGLTFWITHGHQYNVDFGIEGLKHHIKNHHCDIVCFGHTHNPTYIKEDGTIYLNPGSLSYPRGRYMSPTYCLFDTKTKEVTYYDLKTGEKCDPFHEEPKEKFSLFKMLFQKK